MPELPDVVVYIESLSRRIVGRPLQRIRLANPFFLRSVAPSPAEVAGQTVVGLRRLGKRIVIELDGDLFVVLHLMIAGRLHWRPAGARIPGRLGLAALDFAAGAVTVTEAGTRKRASLHLVRGTDALAAHDPAGIEVLAADLETFRTVLVRENHTLKRALTDPRLFSGIGNAYSDEILHRARLSPVRLTRQLDPDEVARLHAAIRTTLVDWTERLRRETGEGFPERVTAFRDEMAVHGRWRQPCPTCGAPVQRIVYADNETNYCAGCQTGGVVLADRSLSRLLKSDWPRRLEELDDSARSAPTGRPGR
ncbi:MAG TPA: DNA-formamidopyrimidine glycosylase family protein [Candidatus Binatia bacterium]|nr:DNA-formamidopyrimidine glycosylase family protein [Candidatus Binatia bacterium]